MPEQIPTWAKSIEFLRSVNVDAAAHTADLLDSAESRWNDRVIPRTSMHDLLFTVPGDDYPFAAQVRVSWSDDAYEFRLSRGSILVAADRCHEQNALNLLDASSRAACPRHPCLTISKRRVRGGCPFVGSSSPSATAGSWFLPGVLVAPRWGDPFWGIVGMPTVLGHDSELSGRDHLDDLLARQPNCELRFALQDEEKLVTCAVALPWRTAAEGGHTAQAAVESEATYRTVGFCIQLREIESGHFANRIRAEVVDNHRAHLRHGVQPAPCGIPLVDHPRIRDHWEASLITNDVVELP